MLLNGHDDGLRPRNLITITELPASNLNPQATQRKEPYRTVTSHAFCHTLSLVTFGYPQDALQAIMKKVGRISYAKVHMKLIELISGDFFDRYIKTGNILMLSEGRPGHDELFTLRDGVLRLEVDKPTFQRIGLEGKPISGPGRKHVDARYAIELNLRSPSMVDGKKGFERVRWAFKNVLVDAKTWLFCNLSSPDDFSGPISSFAPSVRQFAPAFETVEVQNVDFHISVNMDKEDIAELQEWLSLLILDSPRIKTDDRLDRYLCRYDPPQLTSMTSPQTVQLLKAQWRGLIHAGFVSPLLKALLEQIPSKSWLALSAHAFDNTSYTIIHKDGKLIICDFKD